MRSPFHLMGFQVSWEDAAAESKEYCSNEKFAARCGKNEVIIIQRAQYGRMRNGRCISAGYMLGCYADVTTHLETLCTGQSNCSVLVGTLDSVAQPCEKDLQSYLEASYQCVKVSASDTCHARTNSTLLTEPSGYLLLRPPPQSQLPCPWRLESDPGRRINITRIRLSSEYGFHNPGDGTLSSNGHVCPYVLKIADENHVTTYEPCTASNNGVNDVIYTSRSSRVVMKVIWRDRKMRSGVPSLYHYKVFGCKNLVPPEGASMTRYGENVKVVCNATQKTWYLTCRDGDWVGEPGNCTNAKDIPQISALPNPPKAFQNGIMIAVLIGVVLGIVVGAFMLFLIYLLKKGRRRDTTREPSTAVESHYDTRLRVGAHMDTTASYPALLCQEKPCGAHTCEYTHVWNMHPAGLEPTYIASTLDRQSSCPSDSKVNENPTSTFTCRRGAGEQSAGVEPERISLDNLRSTATPLVANMGSLEPPPEPFTPAYYELEAKLQSNKTLPRMEDFPEFHVVFKNPVDPL
ncbi:hypothetical protein CAPTEDRAFT_207686 [Capitella teleta]|uniref:SUEL-type lectin domain-containing protein n=1 Tax=Capitella teleta TaxID=283909 RepID=R7V2G2_CAPTE|nr:hypothetical protein CAPTEDRAFT_207686 [Capitella teleta]|eukprot:ELU09896.1 hypothetical protein CAPTEDRAFT_207686 [Capitella teleta]